jgi:hypothetical protein
VKSRAGASSEASAVLIAGRISSRKRANGSGQPV